MFFNDQNQLKSILRRVACAIIALPSDTDLALKNALTLRPADDKKTRIISVEQIREFLALTNSRETTDRYFVITPADAMNEAAQNAFLKTFEEPRPFCHFILLTEQPTLLLPTILSRAQVFYPHKPHSLDTPPTASAETLALAKRPIAASPHEIIEIATVLSKQKTQPREKTLAVVDAAIELLYKSYFKTNNSKFLHKLPNFIRLHENLAANGHIRLQIVTALCC